ncbi:MAG: T9SS type A sorting domain-containing protein [Sphingobacteriales bacterium]|nr:T9SS type A sorting domain-containing protein [Sphingobacteriales bacterium]
MEFSIFPNPSNNNITVKATSDKKNSAIVDIIDVNGRNCYHFEDQNANKNEFQYDINLSSFARGTYFLRLQIGDVSDTRTFIKH